MVEVLLKSLDKIVDPAHTALIIVDPQHDFCSERGAMAQRGRSLFNGLSKRLE
jgi:nicotinamidase-related amidase